MIDRNSQLGWTDAQWNQVRQAVAEEWQRVRVAGSLLPNYGPLPASTAVVPSEVVRDGGTIDDAATARIIELSSQVELTRQQVNEEDLSDAVLLFRRAAAAVARQEDRVVFNGQQPDWAYDTAAIRARAVANAQRFPRVDVTGFEPSLGRLVDFDLHNHIETLISQGLSAVDPIRNRTAWSNLYMTASQSPGTIGLVFAAASAISNRRLTSGDLVATIVDAIGQLDAAGFGAPFGCFLGKDPFSTAYRPIAGSLVLPSDRIEPLLGQPIVRAAALDEGPAPANNYAGRGLVISLAGNGLDLAVASEAAPEFMQVNGTGRYIFRVAERFALRIKDNNSIVRLEFTQ